MQAGEDDRPATHWHPRLHIQMVTERMKFDRFQFPTDIHALFKYVMGTGERERGRAQ